MILLPRTSGYKDILDQYESENNFSFNNSTILPAEQRDILYIIYGHNSGKQPTEETEEEKRSKETIAKKIIEKMHDPRLKEKGRINSYIYSPGGSYSTKDEDERDELTRNGSKVAYVVMELNGLVIMEAIGQLGNATYIAEKDEELEENITKMGRGEALSKDVMYKIVHDQSDGKGYNYNSNHIVNILEYAISNPQGLMKVLRENESYCNLSTLVKRMKKSEERDEIE